MGLPRRLANHVRALNGLAPGLKGRNPGVWLPLSVTTLEAARRRRAKAVPTDVRPGVTARRVSAPASEGRTAADAYVYVPTGAPARLDAEAAGLLDASYRWLLDNADELGVDVSRIAIGGGSGGGGLAAALVQRAHDEGLPVAYQLLVEPMLDDRTVPRAEAADVAALAWTVPSNRFGWTSYLGHETGAPEDRPYAVPARRADLSGLPPAYIGIGDADLVPADR